MLCAAAAVTVAAQSKVAILPPEEEIGILTHSPITDESIGNNTMKEGTIQHYILYASNTIPDALFWLNFFSVFFLFTFLYSEESTVLPSSTFTQENCTGKRVGNDDRGFPLNGEISRVITTRIEEYIAFKLFYIFLYFLGGFVLFFFFFQQRLIK
jgi:hypothetical protein